MPEEHGWMTINTLAEVPVRNPEFGLWFSPPRPALPDNTSFPVIRL